MKKTIFLFLCLALSGFLLSQELIIVHPNVSEDTLSKNTIRQIFLGKKTTWSDGQVIVPITLAKGPVHANFIKSFVNKTSNQYDSYWKHAIFTGRGVPPKSFKSEEELIEYVANTDGAIGYIHAATPHEGVKVIQLE